MKKLINAPDDVVADALRGFEAATATGCECRMTRTTSCAQTRR